MLSNDDILKISRDTNISVATIGQLIELILLRKKNEQEITLENLKLELEKFIIDMKTPQKWYSVRTRLGTNYERLIYEFSNRYTKGIFDQQIPNLYYFHVQGPVNLQQHDIKILIDRFAAESVMIGANLFIPGIIKVSTTLKKNDNISMFGPNNLLVGNGISKIDSKNLPTMRKGIAIETTESIYKLPPYRTSELYNEGIISDQVFASLIACWTLMSLYTHDAQILDMCSAPGHKTCALSEIGYYLNKDVFPNIISVDRSSSRLESLKEEINRLKLKNIKIITSKIQNLSDKHPELIGANDLVILDPPCSALGTRPKTTIDHSWDNYRDFFLTQRLFLKLIDNFVKPGGYLLYNTCTLTLLENEAIVSYAKDKLGYRILHVLEQLDKIFPKRFSKNINEFGNELNPGIPFNIKTIESYPVENLADLQKYHTLSEEDSKKVCRTYPENLKTTGYFFALLQKE